MAYYIATVKVQDENERGRITNTNEVYCVEAETVTEAEAKVVKEFEGYSLDYHVKSVKQSKILAKGCEVGKTKRSFLIFSARNKLHPVVIVISVLFFGGIWGFWGLFFAIPLATFVKAIINSWPQKSLN